MTVDRESSTFEAQGGAYRFRHALLAEAVLDQFLPGERAAVHAIIAEVLGQRPALSTGPSELGYHQAAAGDLPDALASYLAAANDAEHVYAFGEAGGYLERALDLWARVPDAADATGRSRGDVLVGVAQNLGGAGDFDRAVAYATAALAEPEIAGDPERGAELWQRIARYHLQDGNGPPAFAAYQAAATLLDSAPPARGRSRLAADHALALAIWDRNDEAVTQAERAVCLAAEDGDLAARGLALNASGVARTSVGRIEDGERDLREALDLARAYGSIEDIARATMNLGYTLLSAGRNEESLELSETAIAENEDSGLDLRRGALNRINASEALFALGRWDEAIAQADAVRNRIEFRFAARRASITRARVARRGARTIWPRRCCLGWSPMARGKVSRTLAWTGGWLSRSAPHGPGATTRAGLRSPLAWSWRPATMPGTPRGCALSVSGSRQTAAYPLTRVALAARKRLPGTGPTSLLRRSRTLLGPATSRPG